MIRTPTVAVVGAGFSGTLTAIHLLWRAGPMRVLLFNRGGPMGPGLAYGTSTPLHRLNVVAGRMSAFPEDEDSFLRFAQSQDPTVTGSSFVSRSLYGAYLKHLLADAERNGPGILERVGDEVISIRAGGLNGRLTTAEGRTFTADRVVLALGNAAPAGLDFADTQFNTHPNYIGNPWDARALDPIQPNQVVLLIGTGLTMLDTALQLRDRGAGTIHAVSRRGLLPQAHRSPSRAPSLGHRPPGIEAGPATARAYFHAVRAQIRRLAADGIDWREVINSLRPITPRLWQALSVPERARFLRHVRPFWEAHRHRVPPEVNQIIEQMTAARTLLVQAGRLQSIAPEGARLQVVVKRRGSSLLESISADWVVNCTGPSMDIRRVPDRVLQAMLRSGLIRSDPLAIGLDTAQDGALVNAAGRTSKILYYVGPLLRARFWESTAIPELRQHASSLAQTLIDSLARPAAYAHQAV
jgi:uncharacterized NAD(P)/FAD-binding protein YdhS